MKKESIKVWEDYINTHKIDTRIKPFKSRIKKKKSNSFVPRIDLHGRTCDQAYDDLKIFLAQASNLKITRITIITVSAYKIIEEEYVPTSILRKEVPRWLLYTDISLYVKHFEYADSRDGGNGAIYVYVKLD